MEIIYSKEDLENFIKSCDEINFIPTMGNLHNGHLNLVRESRKFKGSSLVSIYVNPLQFAANEDLAIYPRSLEADIKKLELLSCDAVFCPENDFSNDAPRLIANPMLAQKLCGLSRPHFFDGVISILSHFFRLIHPKNVFFGLKDYQQFLIVKDYLLKSNIKTTIHGIRTEREIDGLAMSSRNNLLSTHERDIAKNLYITLCYLSKNIRNDTIDNLKNDSIKKLNSLGFDVDYLCFCNSVSLDEVSKFEPNILIALAAKLGSVRLIDNIFIK